MVTAIEAERTRTQTWKTRNVLLKKTDTQSQPRTDSETEDNRIAALARRAGERWPPGRSASLRLLKGRRARLESSCFLGTRSTTVAQAMAELEEEGKLIAGQDSVADREHPLSILSFYLFRLRLSECPRTSQSERPSRSASDPVVV